VQILELIDSLEELVVQARRLPVGGNLVVDRKRMLDIIDQLRLGVPVDLRQAAEILETRESILKDARESAEQMRAQTEHERARRLDENVLVRESRERAQQLLIDAEERARQAITDADAMAAAHLSEAAEAAQRQMEDIDNYALEILRRLEEQLSSMLDAVQSSIGGLQEQR
jgi:vacuolar-type H+-ATPase subunit H